MNGKLYWNKLQITHTVQEGYIDGRVEGTITIKIPVSIPPDIIITDAIMIRATEAVYKQLVKVGWPIETPDDLFLMNFGKMFLQIQIKTKKKTTINFYEEKQFFRAATP